MIFFSKKIKKPVFLIIAILLLITGCSKSGNNISENIISEDVIQNPDVSQVRNLVPDREVIRQSIKDSVENIKKSGGKSPERTTGVFGSEYFSLSKSEVKINTTTPPTSELKFDFLYIEGADTENPVRYAGTITYYFNKPSDEWVLLDKNIDFSEIITREISGKIVNNIKTENKIPVPKAIVYAISTDGEITKVVETDEEGLFTIPDVLNNNYYLHSVKQGYSKKTVDLTTQSSTENINAGEVVMEINESAKYVSITGYVKNQKIPLPDSLTGISVYLLDTSDNPVNVVPDITDAEGKYLLKFVEPGDYKLIAKIQDKVLSAKNITITSEQTDKTELIEVEDIVISNSVPVISVVIPVSDSNSRFQAEVQADLLFEVTAEDADNDSLTYTWSCSDGILDLSTSNRVYWFGTKQGNFEVKVEISDNKGGNITHIFYINLINSTDQVEYDIVQNIKIYDNSETIFKDFTMNNQRGKVIIPKETFSGNAQIIYGESLTGYPDIFIDAPEDIRSIYKTQIITFRGNVPDSPFIIENGDIDNNLDYDFSHLMTGIYDPADGSFHACPAILGNMKNSDNGSVMIVIDNEIFEGVNSAPLRANSQSGPESKRTLVVTNQTQKSVIDTENLFGYMFNFDKYETGLFPIDIGSDPDEKRENIIIVHGFYPYAEGYGIQDIASQINTTYFDENNVEQTNRKFNVYKFDWDLRNSLEDAGKYLYSEIERSNLKNITLIGEGPGGLVIRECLKNRVNFDGYCNDIVKVVFLDTPQRGLSSFGDKLLYHSLKGSVGEFLGGVSAKLKNKTTIGNKLPKMIKNFLYEYNDHPEKNDLIMKIAIKDLVKTIDDYGCEFVFNTAINSFAISKSFDEYFSAYSYERILANPSVFGLTEILLETWGDYLFSEENFRTSSNYYVKLNENSWSDSNTPTPSYFSINDSTHILMNNNTTNFDDFHNNVMYYGTENHETFRNQNSFSEHYRNVMGKPWENESLITEALEDIDTEHLFNPIVKNDFDKRQYNITVMLRDIDRYAFKVKLQYSFNDIDWIDVPSYDTKSYDNADTSELELYFVKEYDQPVLRRTVRWNYTQAIEDEFKNSENDILYLTIRTVIDNKAMEESIVNREFKKTDFGKPVESISFEYTDKYIESGMEINPGVEFYLSNVIKQINIKYENVADSVMVFPHNIFSSFSEISVALKSGSLTLTPNEENVFYSKLQLHKDPGNSILNLKIVSGGKTAEVQIPISSISYLNVESSTLIHEDEHPETVNGETIIYAERHYFNLIITNKSKINQDFQIETTKLSGDDISAFVKGNSKNMIPGETRIIKCIIYYYKNPGERKYRFDIYGDVGIKTTSNNDFGKLGSKEVTFTLPEKSN